MRYRISPLDARGQYDVVNNFAYVYSGKVCYRTGKKHWLEGDREEGVRIEVQLADNGPIGYVWEDELETVCDPTTCKGCWECDP